MDYTEYYQSLQNYQVTYYCPVIQYIWAIMARKLTRQTETTRENWFICKEFYDYELRNSERKKLSVISFWRGQWTGCRNFFWDHFIEFYYIWREHANLCSVQWTLYYGRLTSVNYVIKKCNTKWRKLKAFLGVIFSPLKALTHGANFLATCNAIVLLRDVNLWQMFGLLKIY